MTLILKNKKSQLLSNIFEKRKNRWTQCNNKTINRWSSTWRSSMRNGRNKWLRTRTQLVSWLKRNELWLTLRTRRRCLRLNFQRRLLRLKNSEMNLSRLSSRRMARSTLWERRSNLWLIKSWSKDLKTSEIQLLRFKRLSSLKQRTKNFKTCIDLKLTNMRIDCLYLNKI